MPTSTKTIIVGLCGILLIGGAVYFAKPKSIEKLSDNTGTTQEPIKTAPQQTEQMANTQEPTPESSSDAIVDYIADTLTENETQAVTEVINAGVPVESDVVIGTNF